MIDYGILKRLVLEVFSSKPNTPVKRVINQVEKLAARYQLIPSPAGGGYKDSYRQYNRKPRLSPVDRKNVTQIIWSLIRENLLLIGADRLN